MKDSQLLRYSRQLMLPERTPHQASQVRRCLRMHGYLDVRTLDDLGARPRLSLGRTP